MTAPTNQSVGRRKSFFRPALSVNLIVSKAPFLATKKAGIYSLTTVLALSGLLAVLIPRSTHAGQSFYADWNYGSLDANNTLGSGAFSYGARTATITTPGYGGTGGALNVGPYQTAKYQAGSNISSDKGEISFRFTAPLTTPAYPPIAKGLFSYTAGITYNSVTGKVSVVDTTSRRVITTTMDGTGWTSVGTGDHVSSTGQGTFSGPYPVDHDPVSGDLFIGDVSRNQVIRMAPDGSTWRVVLTTTASPTDVDYDPVSEALYVLSDDKVIKVPDDGSATSETTGFLGGSGAATSVVYDGVNDWLYVGLYSSSKIVRLKLDGSSLSSFGAPGSGVNQFDFPVIGDVNSSTGDIYIADTYNNHIVRTRMDGSVWQVLGTEGRGDNQFTQPFSVAFNPATGDLYVSDKDNHRIVRTRMDGSVWQSYGSFLPVDIYTGLNNVLKGVPGTDQVFGASQSNTGPVLADINRGQPWRYMENPNYEDGQYKLKGVDTADYDSNTGYFYAIDRVNSRIIRSNFDQTAWQEISYTSGSGSWQLGNVLYGLVYDPGSNSLYLADMENTRIIHFKMDGSLWEVHTIPGVSWDWEGSGGLQDLEFDAATGDLYILDKGNGRLIRTRMDGSVWQEYGSYGSGIGQFKGAESFSLDHVTKDLYVADTLNNRIVRTRMDGSVWQVLNSQAFEGYMSLNQLKQIYYDQVADKVIVAGTTYTHRVKMDGSLFETMRSPYSGGERTILETTSPLGIRLAYSGNDSRFVFTPSGLTYGALARSTSVALTAGSWYQLRVRYVRSTGSVQMYIDGTLIFDDTIEVWSSANYAGATINVGGGNEDERFGGLIDDLTFDNLSSDVTPPAVPTDVTLKSVVGGSVLSAQAVPNALATSWYNYATPEFSWSAVSDSGAVSYIPSLTIAAPATTFGPGVVTSTPSYVASGLADGNIYRFAVRTRDAAGNLSTPTEMFRYGYDITAPLAPTSVVVSPAGYSTTNTYSFTWPASGAGSASDPGAPTTGSGVVGYQYKTGATTGAFTDWSATTTDTSVLLSDLAYQNGANTFLLRAVDAAGNVSTPTQATFYFSGTAPGAPRSFVVSPETTEGTPATTNTFAFSWQAPTFSSSTVKNYRYSVNALPSAANSTVVTPATLAAASYATQQGKNTLFVVAEDEAGNVDYNAWGSVDFYVTTAAPGIPRTPLVTDVSLRGSEYRLGLSWLAPLQPGTGFAGYDVYRALAAESTFAKIGSTASTSYVDTGLTQGASYKYYIVSRGDAGSVSAPSTTVTGVPTGRFTTAPALIVKPTASTKATAATINWQTDRECRPFVRYGLTAAEALAGGASVGKQEQAIVHAVEITSLQEDAQYYAQVTCEDIDGNRVKSDVISFSTSTRPSVQEVAVSGITTTAATLSWASNVVITATVQYGTTKSYGKTQNLQSTGATTRSTVLLSGLDSGTIYHFRIRGSAPDGSEVVGDDYSFTTLPLPKVVGDISFEKVVERQTNTARVSWKTNIATTSIVSYTGPVGYRESGLADLVTDHTVEIADLPDGANLTIAVSGRDEGGNIYKQEAAYTTPTDTRPPKISEVKIQSTAIGADRAATAQVIIHWVTNKPAKSFVRYTVGSIPTGEYSQSTAQTASFSEQQGITIENLPASSILAYELVSVDEYGNQVVLGKQSLVTKDAPLSAMTLVTSKLNNSLGFIARFFSL